MLAKVLSVCSGALGGITELPGAGDEMKRLHQGMHVGPDLLVDQKSSLLGRGPDERNEHWCGGHLLLGQCVFAVQHVCLRPGPRYSIS